MVRTGVNMVWIVGAIVNVFIPGYCIPSLLNPHPTPSLLAGGLSVGVVVLSVSSQKKKNKKAEDRLSQHGDRAWYGFNNEGI